MKNTLTYMQLFEQVARRNEELAVMMDIGKALTSSLDLEEILNSIMTKVSVLLRPKMWSLLLLDQQSSELYFKIVVSPVAEELKKIRIKLGEGIAGWVAEHGEPLLIADVKQDNRFATHIDAEVAFTTKSVICVPMKIKTRVVGIIELVNSLEDMDYNETDLALLSAIADYAAIAIENAQTYNLLNRLVITDELTGLYNAHHFNVLFDRELANAQKHEVKVSLVFFDLDHFKKINDTYGHLVGSKCLSEVGAILKHCIRSEDYASRFGGDEFVILLPNTDKAQAISIVSGLRNRLNGYRFDIVDDLYVSITASFGISTYPDDAISKIALMRMADEAMYAVKERSRDAVLHYSCIRRQQHYCEGQVDD